MGMPTPAATDGASIEQTVWQANTQPAPPSRRRVESADAHLSYSAHCWAPSSAFSDPSCNCLGKAAHPKLGSRRTINVIAPGW